MNFGETYISKKKIILGATGLTVLIVGLIVGVYLVQVRQIFKGRAATVTPATIPPGNFVNAFIIKDDQGRIITCDDREEIPVCQVPSKDIKMRIQDASLLLPTPTP